MSPTTSKLPTPITIPPTNAYTHPTPPLTPLTPHPLTATPPPPPHLLSTPYSSQLGTGAWSTVYALTPALAVKTPSNPSAIPILGTEAAILSRLTTTLKDASCIARIHYYDPKTAHLYLDHLPAGTLESLSRSAGGAPRGAPVLGFAQWLFAAERLVAAVAAVHGAGVVHGDVKWGNVLLREYKPSATADDGGDDVWDRWCAETGETLYEPVLCDFSSAQVMGGEGEGEGEVSAVTTGFAAPEVLAGFLKGAPAVGVEADVYSVGMTLLAAALGTEVYEGVRHVGIYARQGDPVGWVRGGERAARVGRGSVVAEVLQGCFGRVKEGRVGLGVIAERVEVWKGRWWEEGRKGGRWGW